MNARKWLHTLMGVHHWHYRHQLYRQCRICNERQALYHQNGHTFWCTRYPLTKREIKGTRVKPWFVLAQKYQLPWYNVLGIYRSEAQAEYAAWKFVAKYPWGQALLRRKRGYGCVGGGYKNAKPGKP